MSQLLSLRRLADVSSEDSLSNRMRSRRFAFFESLAATLQRPLRILDIGGTSEFWRHRGWAGRDDVAITLINLEQERDVPHNMVSVVGDATRLPEYGDRSFDIVFSNSVIEHLFTRSNQEAMAREVQRIGRAYWVQTPNFWFPIEPHFHVPGWQWMPQQVRVALLQRRRCGWRGPCPDRSQAEALVKEVRLLRRGELRRMFPGATIRAERFAGLTKSYIMYGGFGQPAAHATGSAS